MSSTRRVHVEVTGNASGAINMLRQLRGGISQSRREMGGASRDMTLWSNQMKAFGTTARYALAGSLVFGVTSAVGALTQLEQKMGDIAALTVESNGRGGFTAAARSEMEALADTAIRQSTRLGIGVDQIQNAMQTYYSSFQNVKRPEVEQFSSTLTKLAAVAETTDQQKLAEGLIGVANSLGGGRKAIPREADIISKVVAQSVGFRGDVLAQNLGRLGGAAGIGGFSDSQMAAVLTTASQVGGSPAVIARGVTQLMNNILNPKQKAQKEAYMQAGLPTDPNSLSNYKYKGQTGGFAVLRKMMDAVSARGGLKTNRGGLTMSDEQASSLDENAPLSAFGIGGGGGTSLAYGLFGRQESLRQFVGLMSQGPEKLDNFLKSMSNATGQMNAMFSERNKFNQLARAQNAVTNMGLMAVRAGDPALRPIASGLNAAGNFMADHPNGTRAVLGTGMAIGTTRLLSKLLPGMVGSRVGRLPGPLGKLLSGMSNAERAALSGALGAEAAPAMISGGGGADMGMRSNPMWVIIHPNSWLVGTPGGGGPGFANDNPNLPSKSTKVFDNILKKAGYGGAAAAGGGAAAGGAALAVAGAGALTVGGAGAALAYYMGSRADKNNKMLYQKYPWLRNVLAKRERGKHLEYYEQQAIALAHLGKIDSAHDVLATKTGDFRKAGHLADLMGGKRGGNGQAVIQVQGDVGVGVGFDLTDAAKKLLTVPADQHIATKLWSGSAPQHKGKPTDKKQGASR